MGHPVAHPFALSLRAALEAKPKLKLYHASRERAQRAPEVSCVSEIGIAPPAGLEGRKVENIKDVEEVGPDLQVRRLAEMQEPRQPRLFDYTEID
jgi:hypothetical protein